MLLALIAGLSTLARSANIVLVAAIPVWLYLQNATRKQLMVGTVAAFAPFVLWATYRRSMPNANDYLDGVTLQYAVTELGGWPDLLYLHPWQMISGFARNLDNTPDAFSLSIAIAILVCAAYGWWQRVRAKKLDAVFFAFYLAMILVWPYPSEAMRFITFLLPLLFLYALLGVQRLAQTFPASSRSKTRAPALLALLVALASATTIWHFLDLATLTVDEELRGEQRTQMYFTTPDRATALRSAEGNARIRLTAREATRLIPADDCAYATLPSLLEMHGPVRVLPYPDRFVEGIPVESQLRLCNYFFVSGLRGNSPSHQPFHPAEKLRAWTTPLLVADLGDGSIVAALLIRQSGTAPSNDANHAQPGKR